MWHSGIDCGDSTIRYDTTCLIVSAVDRTEGNGWPHKVLPKSVANISKVIKRLTLVKAL